jgi:hypothetical protein
MIGKLRRFGAFWYDFIVGDDWRVAIGVVIALALTYLVSTTSVSAWWILPVAVVVLLPITLWREVRRR